MSSVPPEVFLVTGIAAIVSLIAIYAARFKDFKWFFLALVVLWALGALALARYSPSYRHSFWFDVSLYAGGLLIPAAVYALAVGMLVRRKAGAVAMVSMVAGATVVGHFLYLITLLYVSCYVFNDCP